MQTFRPHRDKRRDRILSMINFPSSKLPTSSRNRDRSPCSEQGTDRSAAMFFPVSDLRSRGRSDRLITRYLGEPERTVPNPKIKSGSPKRLYAVDRVLVVEENPDFYANLNRSKRYANRLKAQADLRGATVLQLAAELPLPALLTSFPDLLDAARKLQREDVTLASQPVLRLALNLSLGTMGSIGWQLDDFVGQTGVREARKLLRRRMLAHIIDHYPALAEVALERAKQEDGSAGSW